MAEIAKKKDFVELKFSGYANGELFDSNIEEDLKKLNPKAKPKELIIAIGQGMIVEGLDRELDGKEIGKEYEIEVKAKDGFGERKRELVKTIPLKVFTEKEIYPRAGMVLTMDNMLARVIAVSGARVVTDFNNPLASKDLKYKIKIVRKIDDEKEKAKALFEFVFRFVPEFEIKEEIVVRGPKVLEHYVKRFSDKFRELIGKGLKFEEKEEMKANSDAKDKKD